MYKYTFKMMCVELIAVALALYMAVAGVAAGWFVLGLRDGAMFGWCLLSAVAAVTPFLVVLQFRGRI